MTLSAFAKEKLLLTKVDACMPISFLRAIHAHCINFRISRTFFAEKNMSFTPLNWTQEWLSSSQQGRVDKRQGVQTYVSSQPQITTVVLQKSF